ncbi:ribonuclease R [Pontibacter sp. BT310]|uniref:Ribonuclease R n=1 Tax=Pontibacter populi TaxID=890055 RepID=A0ABS6X9C2_9BACT|nr:MULTISPECIES: ribonuclease R [Pontibacter]MBJ6117614.1 ribonuclease R [Pontibacter sp. BT310]MBR0570039.1 ribonuclease R [Microvirga sp. STS03]MBW3364466.1 ribonuclease R [Pontibacter populi]
MRGNRDNTGGRGKGRSEKGGSRRGESSSRKDGAPRGESSSRRESTGGGRGRSGDRRESSGRREGGRDRSAKGMVLELFSKNPDTDFTLRQIYRRLGVVDKKGRELVSDMLAALQRESRILVDEDKYTLNLKVEIITGRVDMANNKYAYIVSEQTEDDVRVFREHLNYAMDGDTVKVEVLPTYEGGRAEGIVVEIIERRREELVGIIQLSKNFGFVVPDFKKLYFDIFVGERGLNGANNGDKVLVKITEWPDKPGKNPTGEVTRVFGPAGEHEAEIHSIMAEFGLPFEFPESVEEEANEISDKITKEEIAKRRDFRDVTTFTIDPADAKDFDDALSIQKLENGNWEIGVHIADVTHYVTPKTILEKEAFHRATSVYLVDRTVPMLPERLSNGLCSLRPNEEKLTFSAVFELDDNGKLYSEWFGRTVIYSDRRFAYEEAQERIETGEGDFAEEINILNAIAKKLKDKRFKNGAISFETTEVKFKLDDNGKPLYIYVKERKDAHKLIEEFMLLANKKVAEFVYNMGKGKKHPTMVYRTHGAPDPDKLSTFSIFARKFGYKVDPDGNISAELNNLAEETEGKPEQNVLQNLAIRTMAKAKYSTEPEGHFGLAFAHYSHFTSPIRRYPDMMAHRLLQHYLDGGPSTEKDEYEAKCQHSSEMEKRAADAERASIKYKQVEFMKDTIGNQYKGIVSGVTEWGIFVEIEENKCEGMVRLSSLNDDYYELDANNYRIIGRQNKRIISFGDEVLVEVVSANLNDRTIDLELVETLKTH